MALKKNPAPSLFTIIITTTDWKKTYIHAVDTKLMFAIMKAFGWKKDFRYFSPGKKTPMIVDRIEVVECHPKVNEARDVLIRLKNINGIFELSEPNWPYGGFTRFGRMKRFSPEIK